MPHIGALLQDLRLYGRLEKFDDYLAATARAAGCHCGGRLHSACYRRKPRGGPVGLGDGYGKRWSFCCAEDGCRRRVTPPSVRFLGRKIFLGAVVILLGVAQGCVTAARLASLREYAGVSVRTIKRWIRWWRTDFAGSAFWTAARGLCRPPAPEATALPAGLLCSFEGDGEVRIFSLLRFISPVTTCSAKREVGK